MILISVTPNAPKFEDRSQEETEWQERCAREAVWSENGFLVDPGASMHLISKNDLNSAEMDTLTKLCSPATVMTANGEGQTHEEATV